MLISSSPSLHLLLPPPPPTPKIPLSPPKTLRRTALLSSTSLLPLFFFPPPSTSSPPPPPPPPPRPVADFSEIKGSGGVKALDLRSGDGEIPVDGDQVAIHYYGRLAAKQGWRFDSTYDHKDEMGGPLPFVFVLGSGKFFDRQRLFTTIFNPTRLANGEGSTLGTLIFDIEVVSVRHP